MAELRMPSLGADMDAGTLASWLIKVGDRVARGQIVGEVDTQKGIIELECWEEGTVEALLVEPGAKVPVGTVLARIAEGPATARSTVQSALPERPPAPSAAAPLVASPPLEGSREQGPLEPATGLRDLRVSPAARQLARELGIDLRSVPPTGPHGSITRDDVLRASTTPPAHPAHPAPFAPSARVSAPMPRPSALAPMPSGPAPAGRAAIRGAIAAAMARSKREIPHYYLSTTIDLSASLAWLEEQNRARPPAERVLPAALLLWATVQALREVPELNGFWVDGAHVPSAAVHLGVGVALRATKDTPSGLVAPAIRDAHAKSLTELMAALRDLVGRARAGRMRSSELSDGTITVTNLGDLGVEEVFGVIYPPQVALVGFGKIAERPWADRGMLAVRRCVTATLAADHRASDGHRGGLFLAALARVLSAPPVPPAPPDEAA